MDAKNVEHEAMTPKQVLDEMRDCLNEDRVSQRGVVGAHNVVCWADAIDAHLSRAAVAWEYYYRVDECNAESAHDPNCICWHPEGSGHFKDAKHDESSPILGWRRTTHPPEPTPDAKNSPREVTLQQALCVLENAALEGTVLYGDDIPRFRAAVDRITQHTQLCETCRGVGTVDLTLGGISTSDPAAHCPDCDGRGEIGGLVNQADPCCGGHIEKDAARYRWLREHMIFGRMGGSNFAINCDEPPSEWDAAIDAAMEQDR